MFTGIAPSLGVNIKGEQYIFASNNKAYSFTLLAQLEKYTNYSPILENLIRTLEISVSTTKAIPKAIPEQNLTTEPSFIPEKHK